MALVSRYLLVEVKVEVDDLTGDVVDEAVNKAAEAAEEIGEMDKVASVRSWTEGE
jgi:hypothetical protein